MIDALAVFRLSVAIARESGPGDLFAQLRSRVIVSDAPEWLQEGVQCTSCISFWLGLALGLYHRRPIYGLALSGASVLLVGVLDALVQGTQEGESHDIVQ